MIHRKHHHPLGITTPTTIRQATTSRRRWVPAARPTRSPRRDRPHYHGGDTTQYNSIRTARSRRSPTGAFGDYLYDGSYSFSSTSASARPARSARIIGVRCAAASVVTVRRGAYDAASIVGRGRKVLTTEDTESQRERHLNNMCSKLCCFASLCGLCVLCGYIFFLLTDHVPPPSAARPLMHAASAVPARTPPRPDDRGRCCSGSAAPPDRPQHLRRLSDAGQAPLTSSPSADRLMV